MKTKTILMLLGLAILNYRCGDKFDFANMNIHVDYITANSFVVFGSIDNGTANDYNFVYAEHAMPTINDIEINAHGVRDSLFGFVAGLSANTGYYVRLYITGGDEIKYSEEIKLTTKELTTFTDVRDNQDYGIVKIGEQTWMAENLKYKTMEGAWHYENDSIRYRSSGLLYNWPTAGNVCPEGWHLPSDDEWKMLEQNLGMPVEEIELLDVRPTPVGNKLRSIDSSFWKTNLSATNEAGFNAIGAGYFNNRVNSFQRYKSEAYFWTNSTVETPFGTIPVMRGLIYDGKIDRIEMDSNNGLSVRCIKD